MSRALAIALVIIAFARPRQSLTITDIPEEGIDVVVTSWQGLFAPAKTPDAILDKIEAATKKGMTDPKWEAALTRDGLEMPPERTRAQFAKFVADEHNFWGRKLKELKIEME